ncbi:MAG: hypothetical protein HRU30_12860 [Rhodobacteraceae bacterium]|nr:hypothetical protein [Paracoccaceae bacterium]
MTKFLLPPSKACSEYCRICAKQSKKLFKISVNRRDKSLTNTAYEGNFTSKAYVVNASATETKSPILRRSIKIPFFQAATRNPVVLGNATMVNAVIFALCRIFGAILGPRAGQCFWFCINRTS